MDNKNNNNNCNHEKQKALLKTIGFILLTVGGILFIVFLVDFFKAFMTPWAMPQLPFLAFIAFPMLFAGGVCLSYAYMGKVARYTSKEINPVVKDSTNYILDGTKESIAGVVREIKSQPKSTCPYCGDQNNLNANFCDNCGKQLSKVCSDCGAKNQSGAKYCSNCGKYIY